MVPHLSLRSKVPKQISLEVINLSIHILNKSSNFSGSRYESSLKTWSEDGAKKHTIANSNKENVKDGQSNVENLQLSAITEDEQTLAQDSPVAAREPRSPQDHIISSFVTSSIIIF